MLLLDLAMANCVNVAANMALVQCLCPVAPTASASCSGNTRISAFSNSSSSRGALGSCQNPRFPSSGASKIQESPWNVRVSVPGAADDVQLITSISSDASALSWNSRSLGEARVSASDNALQSTGGTGARSLEAAIERLIVREAHGEDELSAAAFVRARSFYSYPEGRSAEAQELHQKLMAALECKTLLSKVKGTEIGFSRVACLIALCPELPLSDEVIDACKVTISGEDLLVVGTLDINQGRHLPGEMQGSRPQGSHAERGRAYISNFCVAEEARRKGVGSALVKQAKLTARQSGVSDLYVHVVATNHPALKLYTKAGFIYEAEESVAEAHLLARPQRMLLWSDLR